VIVLPIGFLEGLNPVTLLLIGAIAVLLFGERLPEVARSMGKRLVEFRRGFQNLQDELRSAAFADTNTSYGSTSGSDYSTRTSEVDQDVATAPKFVPPPSEPPVTPDL
jgi:sec-independent protein translocase protein TatA